MPYYGPPQHPDFSHPQPRFYNQAHQQEDDFPPELGRCDPVGFMRKGEQVEVRIRGNIWIVGFLVSSLHFISSYLGQGYDVEYKDLRSGHPYREAFRAEDVRIPFQR